MVSACFNDVLIRSNSLCNAAHSYIVTLVRHRDRLGGHTHYSRIFVFGEWIVDLSLLRNILLVVTQIHQSPMSLPLSHHLSWAYLDHSIIAASYLSTSKWAVDRHTQYLTEVPSSVSSLRIACSVYGWITFLFQSLHLWSALRTPVKLIVNALSWHCSLRICVSLSSAQFTCAHHMLE